MAPHRPPIFLWYKKITSYVTIPAKISTLVPELSASNKKVVYGVVAGLLIAQWLGILITNVVNSSSDLTYYVTLSNSAIAPTCLYLMYEVIINGHHTLVIDTIFALFSGTSSTFYHFCDEPEDRLPYCEAYQCFPYSTWIQTNVTGNLTYYEEINSYCATMQSAEAYEKLQHLDFGSAYFLVCMTILMVAKISPAFVKICVYLAVFKECWEAMTYEHRFGKGAGMVFLVACSCSITVVIRFLFNVQKLKEVNPEGGTLAAVKSLYSAAPLRWLFLSMILATGGLYARFVLEDDTTGMRKDYAVPHAFWHIGVMSATVFLSKFAVAYNANCKEIWDPSSEKDTAKMIESKKMEMKATIV